MNIGFLITARLKSSRLKLKLLLPLNGKTVIERVIERAKSIYGISDIVIATSNDPQDLPLVRIAKENDIYYYNGSKEDVLQRLLEASELFGFDYFIGITADNPLFSIYHTNLIVDIIKREPQLDFIYTKGMPIGVNIYGIKIKALKTICEVKKEVDTEIWGYLINRPEIFNVRELEVEDYYKYPKVERITLDHYEDYLFFKKIFEKFPQDTIIDTLDVYKVLDENLDIIEINKHIKQRDLPEEVKQRIDKFFKENKEKIIELKNSIYNP